MGWIKLDKYYSKHTVIRTNVQANTGQMYRQKIVDGQTIGQERYNGLYIQMVEPVVPCNIGHY